MRCPVCNGRYFIWGVCVFARRRRHRLKWKTIGKALEPLAKVEERSGALKPAIGSSRGRPSEKRGELVMFARKKLLTMLFIALALGVGVAWTGKSYWRQPIASSSTQTATEKAKRPAVNKHKYVRRGGLWPRLRWNLRALGDRLESPGKEQMLVQGTLTRADIQPSSPVTLNIDAPNRMTLSLQSGIQKHSVAFDSTTSSRAELSETDQDLVDTVLSDSADRFFIEQVNGATTRCLGVRARLSEKDDAGPFYDIYAVTPREPSTAVTGSKLFYFNSDTLMLDLVRYQVESRNGPVQVEVRLSQWQDHAGQNVPRRIDRLENGTVVMTLVINSAMFGPDTPAGKL